MEMGEKRLKYQATSGTIIISAQSGISSRSHQRLLFSLALTSGKI